MDQERQIASLDEQVQRLGGQLERMQTENEQVRSELREVRAGSGQRSEEEIPVRPGQTIVNEWYQRPGLLARSKLPCAAHVHS